jgi:hypothetical protein
MRVLSASIIAFALSLVPAQAADGFSKAERAAIFKAAGFKSVGGKQVRCTDDVTASYMPGFIEAEDLNGDGKKEAFVRESSLFCYGNTAEAFVLVGQDAKGNWQALLDQVGMALVLDSKSKGGWKDIEVGGPGLGPFPKFRHNGTRYVKQ